MPIATSPSQWEINCTQPQSMRYVATISLLLNWETTSDSTIEDRMHAPCSPPPYDDEGGGVC